MFTAAPKFAWLGKKKPVQGSNQRRALRRATPASLVWQPGDGLTVNYQYWLSDVK
jgi:hypothetical protein